MARFLAKVVKTVDHLYCFVIFQRGWSLGHKVNSVELDTLPFIVENPSFTVEEIIESLAEDEKEELSDVVKSAIGENIWARKKSIEDQKDEDKNNYKAPTYFRQIMEMFKSKSRYNKFGLSYYETQSQVTVSNGYTIPKNLEPVLKVLFAVHYDKDISAESKIKSPEVKTFIFMILCAAIYGICTIKEITESLLFTYWDCFKIAQTAGFNIQFAINLLLNAMHAYLGLQTSCSDPILAKLDEEMKKIVTNMDKLQKTRTQRETSMQLNSKDRLQGSIEIVGKSSWDEYRDVTSESTEGEDDTTDLSEEYQSDSEEEDDDTTDSEWEYQSNMIKKVLSEMSKQQEEEEGTSKARDEMSNTREETPSEMLNLEEHTSKIGEERSSEMPEPKKDEKKEGEEEKSNTREERPSEILNIEEHTSQVGEERSSEMPEPKKDEKKEGEEQKSSTREERPSEILNLEEHTSQVGEERSSEMPEPKKDEKKEGEEEKSSTRKEIQDQSKLPNPWDYIDTYEQTEPQRPTQSGDQEVQNAILNKIKNFIEDNPSKPLSYFAQENRPKSNTTDEVFCSKCNQSIEDRNQGCMRCELPRKINCDIHNDTMTLFRGFKEKRTSNDQINSTPPTNEQSSNKKVVKDQTGLCIACELPISDAKNETYHCPKCKIFLHKFCLQFPTQIQHPLHLHPLKLKTDRERARKIECNVCGEKCRGSAYYVCNYDLQLRAM